jgi:hypothetical protein
MHPIQAEIWRDLKTPRFSGLPQDVAQLIRDWNEVETIVRSASAHPVTDYAMLIELRKALDEPSAEILKSRMLVEPDLKYDEVLNSFQQEWGVDASKLNRADWHAVKLQLTGPKDDPVTLNEWRRYQPNSQLRVRVWLIARRRKRGSWYSSNDPAKCKPNCSESNLRGAETDPGTASGYPRRYRPKSSWNCNRSAGGNLPSLLPAPESYSSAELRRSAPPCYPRMDG